MTRAALLIWFAIGTGCVLAYEARTAGSEGASSDGTTALGSDVGSASDTDGQAACSVEQTRCGDTCVDVQEHPDHCGECGMACDANEACDRGECRDGCRNGETICDRFCFDLSLDEDHCGGCGNACPAGVGCIDGNCGVECQPGCDDDLERCHDGTCICRPGLARCDGECVDLLADPGHCGDCGRTCGAEACGGGECVPTSCDGFADVCGGSCTDVSTDPLHCGDCGERCKALETCDGGECGGT